MEWGETVQDAAGRRLATYEAALCQSESQLDSRLRFSRCPGGFAHYWDQLNHHADWPVAVLLHVNVPRHLRGRGHGKRAVSRFLTAARARHARVGLLRVGWSGEITERDWRVDWYRRQGWRPLDNAARDFLVPYMCHPLEPQGATVLTSE